jgi:hypothetical protein
VTTVVGVLLANIGITVGTCSRRWRRTRRGASLPLPFYRSPSHRGRRRRLSVADDPGGTYFWLSRRRLCDHPVGILEYVVSNNPLVVVAAVAAVLAVCAIALVASTHPSPRRAQPEVFYFTCRLP